MFRTYFQVLFVVILAGLTGCTKRNSDASFSYTGTLRAGYEVTFHTNISNAVDPNHAISYLWTFGDGTISTEASPVHTYRYPSLFSVTCVISGRLGTITRNIQIAPELDFSYTGVPAAGYKITFSGPPAGSFLWNFGDGGTSTEANPVHVFAINDTFRVSLILDNDVAHPIQKLLRIFANGVYLDHVAGSRNWHHTFTSVSPGAPHATTDTLADTTMSVVYMPTGIAVIGEDTLTFDYTIPDSLLLFASHNTNYHLHIYKDDGTLIFHTSTSRIDYYYGSQYKSGFENSDHFFSD